METIGSGKFVLVTNVTWADSNLIVRTVRKEQRFQSAESRTEYRIMFERHGIKIEKEYENE